MVVTGTGPFDRDPQFYCFEGIRMRELAPQRCPSGHVLGLGRMLVGAHPCLCAGTSHRSWRCLMCDRIWVAPACGEHPEWPAWSGVIPGPAQ